MWCSICYIWSCLVHHQASSLPHKVSAFHKFIKTNNISRKEKISKSNSYHSIWIQIIFWKIVFLKCFQCTIMLISLKISVFIMHFIFLLFMDSTNIHYIFLAIAFTFKHNAFYTSWYTCVFDTFCYDKCIFEKVQNSLLSPDLICIVLKGRRVARVFSLFQIFKNFIHFLIFSFDKFAKF